MHLPLEIYGRKKKTHWKTIWKITLTIGVVGIGCFIAAHARGGRSDIHNSGLSTYRTIRIEPAPQREPGSVEELGEDCKKDASGTYRCGSPKIYKKASKITKWYGAQKTIKARITKYSPVESCHYPKWGGNKRKCLTASGSFAEPSRTVACPRNIGFGTLLRIGTGIYRCEDRTAEWVQTKFKYPTFDIFTNSQKEAIDFGARYEEITIME